MGCDGDRDDGIVGAASSSEGNAASPRASSAPLDVLYRDQHIAAICKPPLMHVHRPEFGSKDPEFVLQKARDQFRQRVYFPHRLDRGTSGCLLLAFHPTAAKVLHSALAEGRDSTKTYVALVRGSRPEYVSRGWFTVNRPIKDDKKVEREASTRFLFITGGGNGDSPGPRCSLVLAQPSTGRFHQIRRHLNGLGHPVVGDSGHGDSRFNRAMVKDHGAPPGRLLLHCLSIDIPSSLPPDAEGWLMSTGSGGTGGLGVDDVLELDEEAEEATAAAEATGAPGTGLAKATSGPMSEDESEAGSLAETELETDSQDPDDGTGRRRSSLPLQRPRQHVLKADAINDRGDGEDPATAGCEESRRAIGDSSSQGGGLRVWCAPPQDFVAMLRRIPWLDGRHVDRLLVGDFPQP